MLAFIDVSQLPGLFKTWAPVATTAVVVVAILFIAFRKFRGSDVDIRIRSRLHKEALQEIKAEFRLEIQAELEAVQAVVPRVEELHEQLDELKSDFGSLRKDFGSLRKYSASLVNEHEVYGQRIQAFATALGIDLYASNDQMQAGAVETYQEVKSLFGDVDRLRRNVARLLDLDILAPFLAMGASVPDETAPTVDDFGSSLLALAEHALDVDERKCALDFSETIVSESTQDGIVARVPVWVIQDAPQNSAVECALRHRLKDIMTQGSLTLVNVMDGAVAIASLPVSPNTSMMNLLVDLDNAVRRAMRDEEAEVSDDTVDEAEVPTSTRPNVGTVAMVPLTLVQKAAQDVDVQNALSGRFADIMIQHNLKRVEVLDGERGIVASFKVDPNGNMSKLLVDLYTAVRKAAREEAEVSIDTVDDATELVESGYVKLADGKRVSIRIVGDIVENADHGTEIGEIIDRSDKALAIRLKFTGRTVAGLLD